MSLGRYFDNSIAAIVKIGNDRARMAFARKSLIGIAIAWTTLSILVPILAKHYQVGLDLAEIRCMPWRVYVIKYQRDPAITRGQFVAFRDNAGQMGPKFAGKTVGKQVVGVSGDRLVVRGDMAWVNGKAIGQLSLIKKLGKPPGFFDRDVVVPPGHILVVGTLPESYDGRYWGFLDQRSVIGSLSPLF